MFPPFSIASTFHLSADVSIFVFLFFGFFLLVLAHSHSQNSSPTQHCWYCNVSCFMLIKHDLCIFKWVVFAQSRLV